MHHGFKVCMGVRYIGGYIEYNDPKREWLKERTETWDHNISTISENAGNNPEESYAAVIRAIKPE